MNLQADETLGMRLVAFVVRQVRNLMTVDPRLDLIAERDHAVRIPFSVDETFVRLAVRIRSHPATR